MIGLITNNVVKFFIIKEYIHEKVNCGVRFYFAGEIFYISVFIVGAISIYQTTGWKGSSDRFCGTISDYNLMFLICICVILIAIGLPFLLWGAFEKDQITKI